jgi:hypothetical protein
MAPLGGATEDSAKAENITERTVKTVKSVFAIFQLETAPVQSVPIKPGGKYFTAFALILRLGMGGRGSDNLNRNPGPSHRVAVSRSDVGKCLVGLAAPKAGQTNVRVRHPPSPKAMARQGSLTPPELICKCFIMNDLQNKTASLRSK